MGNRLDMIDVEVTVADCVAADPASLPEHFHPIDISLGMVRSSRDIVGGA